MKNLKIFTFLIVLLGVLWSCDKEDKGVGLEIQPNKNRLKITTVNIQDFKTSSSLSKVIKTNRKKQYALWGGINDSHFGTSIAFINTQYRLPTVSPSFGVSPQLISATLHIAIPYFYGDTTTTLQYKVYQSNFDTDADEAYASNTDMTPYTGDLIADSSIKVNSLTNGLVIHLNKPLSDGVQWGQKILDTDASTLSSNDNFLKIFKGLYLTIDTPLTEKGIIWKCDLSSKKSYIELQYQFTDKDGKTEIKTYKLQFNTESGRFNILKHNTSPLNAILNQKNSSEVYISGMAGVDGNLSFSPLLSWRDSSAIIIYKAELIIKAKASDGLDIPKKILLRIADTTSTYYIDDYKIDATTNYDGTYHNEDSAYHCIITRHVQNFINQQQNDSLVWIVPNALSTNPDRVILNNSKTQPIQLRMSYSKL